MAEDIPIPDQFKRRVAPLSPAERRSSENSEAFVGSAEEAASLVADRDIKFPILVIPQGENDPLQDYHVVNDEEELRDAVSESLNTAPAGKVHIVSKYPARLDSGRRKSEANLK